MRTLKVNDLELTVTVQEHDTSVTGLRYKLVVVLPKRLPKARRSHMPITLNSRPKPSKDVIGPWVLDISNALYRTLGFKYAYNPSVSFIKGATVFTYYFNDIVTAKALGLEISDTMFRYGLKHQEDMAKEGYPCFQRPYL